METLIYFSNLFRADIQHRTYTSIANYVRVMEDIKAANAEAQAAAREAVKSLLDAPQVQVKPQYEVIAA